MKLSDVVNRINGNVDRFTTDLLYYIGGEHFESNELEITKKGLIKENLGVLGFKFHFAFQDRDVLFMARNPHLRKAGMVHFAGLCSDASYILRSKDENVLTQEYLAVMVQSDHFWEYCESHKVGSVNFANNWTSIANYEFELPSIEEQRVIADKVWAAYEVKQSYKNLLEQNDKMLHAQFQKMFGDITDTVKLSQCAKVITGSTPSKARKEYWDNGTYNWVSAFDMKGKYITDTIEKVTKAGYDTCRILQPNSILFVCRGSIGVMSINKVECACNQSICAATCYEKWDEEFVFFVLKEKVAEIQKTMGEGTSFKSISQSSFMNIPIINVPFEQQLAFRQLIEKSDNLRADLEKGIIAIEAVIRSLIAEGTAVLG